jgi:membrane protease YdiL (CAAX protease family)
MSVARKSFLFIGMTLGISWLPLLPALRQAIPSLAPLFFLFGPVIAATVCALLFERGRRLEVLGLSFRPNIWWLVALLLPLALGLVAATANIVIAGQDLTSAQDWKVALTNLGDIAQARYLPGLWLLLPACILLSLLTEEPAWRGYLYYLWRDFGFWRSSVAVGLLWGIWHWPMLLLGVSGEQVGLWGLLEFSGVIVILAVYATLIRDRAGSAIAVAVFHGAWNSVSGPGVGGAYVVIALLVIGLIVIAWRQQVHGGSGTQHVQRKEPADTNAINGVN